MTLLPFIHLSYHQLTEQLIVGHSLRVQILCYGFHLLHMVGLDQCLPHHRLSCAGITDYEHRVSHLNIRDMCHKQCVKIIITSIISL